MARLLCIGNLKLTCISGDRWYRTRFSPIQFDKDNEPYNHQILEEGVIGVVQDVTELKRQEVALESQAEERRKLLASEAAAREASQLKSQFLANVGVDTSFP